MRDPNVKLPRKIGQAKGASGKDQAASKKWAEKNKDKSGSDEVKAAPQKPVVKTEPSVGRNDPCSCGSGKKFKKCCLNK
ncbi:MAG: SEC-C metal-binding domain-containing protein [Elusimicrobiota bacterium]